MRRVTRRVSNQKELFPTFAAVMLTACGALTIGCGEDDNGGAADGGIIATGGRTTAGTATNTGGKATGGASMGNTGGLASTGGTTSTSTLAGTGGLVGAGGNTMTVVGTNTGGTTGTGGAASTGGTGTAVVNTGGTTSTGTTAVGGITSVGGATSTMGGASAGGVGVVGGATATGGTSAALGGSSGIGGEGPDATVGPLRSVDIDLTGMTNDVNHLMVFRVVNANDELVSIGILDPLPAANFSFTLPMAVPEGAHRLEFFADLSGDRAYTPMSTDEGWARPIPPAPAPNVNFAYNTNYTDFSTSPVVPIGEDFTFHATGMTPHVGDMFELRVIVADTGQVVGVYHLHAIPTANFDIVIPGIIANSVPYRVDFWADTNDNGEYNSPPIDHAWRMTGDGTASGLTLSFAHNTDFTDVSF